MDLVFKFIPTFSSFGGLLILAMFFLFFSCWIKISTVFGILRLGLGFYGVPSLLVLSGLSFALTIFVMFPTIEIFSNQVDQKMKSLNASSFDDLQSNEKQELIQTVSNSWLVFLQKNTAKEDIERFTSLALELDRAPSANQELDQGRNQGLDQGGDQRVDQGVMSSWRVLAPAFILSELKKAFSIAFSLFLPFLVIDLLVATILAAVELNNLESQIVSFPLKLLLFVMIDGWGLIAGNLIKSYVS